MLPASTSHTSSVWIQHLQATGPQGACWHLSVLLHSSKLLLNTSILSLSQCQESNHHNCRNLSDCNPSDILQPRNTQDQTLAQHPQALCSLRCVQWPFSPCSLDARFTSTHSLNPCIEHAPKLFCKHNASQVASKPTCCTPGNHMLLFLRALGCLPSCRGKLARPVAADATVRVPTQAARCCSTCIVPLQDNLQCLPPCDLCAVLSPHSIHTVGCIQY